MNIVLLQRALPVLGIGLAVLVLFACVGLSVVR
jgi:hypothetical protein